MNTEEYVEVSVLPQYEREGWKINSSCVFGQGPNISENKWLI